MPDVMTDRATPVAASGPAGVVFEDTTAKWFLLSATTYFFIVGIIAILIAALLAGCAATEYYVQAISGVVLVVSLFFLLKGNESLEPITATASVGFLAGMLIFIWNALPVLRSA